MKLIAGLAILFLLVGCSTDNIKNLEDHVSADCTRHYTGSVTAGLGTQGSVAFEITCAPSGGVKAPPAPTPANPTPAPSQP